MKIENTIICDDIRIENNGKHILVGIYPENLIVAKFPAKFSVQLWVQFFVDRNGDIPIDFRVLGENNVPLIIGEGTMTVNDFNEIVTAAPPKMILEINNKTILKFQMREHGKRWRTVKELPIKEHAEK